MPQDTENVKMNTVRIAGAAHSIETYKILFGEGEVVVVRIAGAAHSIETLVNWLRSPMVSKCE